MKNNKKIDKKLTENKLKDIWKVDNFDPFGSYTGTSEGEEMPVQDADDL